MLQQHVDQGRCQERVADLMLADQAQHHGGVHLAHDYCPRALQQGQHPKVGSRNMEEGHGH